MSSTAPWLRSTVVRQYERWAPQVVRRRRGHVTADPLDLGRIELIRRAEMRQLRDAAWLEHELIPQLGLNDDLPHLFPSELQPALGRGLRAWQWPNQLAPYLAELSKHRISRYIEIGVQHGGTFLATVEYLRRFHGVSDAVAVDVMNVTGVRRYAAATSGVRFLRASSQGRRFRRLIRSGGRWDLVLIDGDHAEAAVRQDFETVRHHAELIAFHDIVDSYSPGVIKVWNEVKEQVKGEFAVHEFTAQYPEVQARKGDTSLGLGLLVRLDRKP
jgi:cephalosporin hydroxylase